MDVATQCNLLDGNGGLMGQSPAAEIGARKEASVQCSDKDIRLATSGTNESFSFRETDDFKFWQREEEHDGLWSSDLFSRLLVGTLKLVAWQARLVFLRVPDVFGAIPHSNSILSIVLLYVFFQAMALLYSFTLVTGSILSTSAVQFVEGCGFTAEEVSMSSNKCLQSPIIMSVAARVYMHFAVIFCCWHFGWMLFDIGWEVYGDLPRLRQALNPRRYPVGLGASTMTQDAAMQQATKIQNLTLIAPLVVFVLLSALLSAAPLLSALAHGGEEGSFVEKALEVLNDSTCRVNRMIRFSLATGLLQWNQQFIAFFPRWYSVLLRMPGIQKLPLLLTFCLIGPPSSLRLVEWFLYPSGRSHLSDLLWGLPHHYLDNLLFLGWSLLLLRLAATLLLNRDAIPESGWRQAPFSDPTAWCKVTFRFKFLVLVPAVVHFCRSLLNPLKGFSSAQNDVLLLTLLYPLGLVVIWAVAFCARALRPWHLLALPLVSYTALFLCRSLTEVNGIGVLLAVWLHLSSQVIQVSEPWSILAVFRRDSPTSATQTASHSHVGPRRSYGYGRRVSGRVTQVFLMLAFGFSCLMGCLGVLSFLQKATAWFPKASFRSTSKVEGRSTRIRNAISQLDLHTSGSPPAGIPQYAACQSGLWGMTVIDYSLLSLAAYFEPNEYDSLLPAIFPPRSVGSGTPMPIHIPSSKGGTAPDGAFWTQFSFPSKKLTVVAVRGTEFWRLSDYLEDIRMWTEPVVFSMLSLVLPTIGSWSPDARAMVTDSLHSLLDSTGLSDLEYKHNRLLSHVRDVIIPSLPDGQTLVLTGHSLGGGMAHIVGALLHLPVVSFSPPGSYQSLAKHLYWNAQDRRQLHHAAHNRTFSLVVENDMVGRLLDTHGGLVQTITCNLDSGILGPLGCHMLESSICNLIQHCQNDHRWTNCEFSYHPEPVIQGLQQHVVDSFRKGELVMYGMVAATLAAVAASTLGMTYIFQEL